MELTEEHYSSKDIRDAAQRILDQALIQTNGMGIFEELGFVNDDGKRIYVTDDPSRLVNIIDRIARDGKIYVLGNR